MADDPFNLVLVVKRVEAISLGYGAEAWRRILAGAERVVVAELLGCMASVLPEWVGDGLVEA